jgi:putative hydrolase of the HAD superfamily
VGSRPVVVFDLDDTLFEERNWARQRIEHGAMRFESASGIQGVVRRALDLFDAEPTTANPLQQAIETAGGAGETVAYEAALAALKSHHPAIRPFEDARYAIDRFRTAARLVVLTEGSEITQLAKLRALGMETDFDEVRVCPVGAKASGAVFRDLIAGCGAVPWIAMIGDNPAKDILPARRVGMHAFLVRRPGTRYVHQAVGEASLPNLRALFDVSPLREMFPKA